MANWEEIKYEWETTEITLADLAEKHGVKLGTLKSRKSRDTKDGNPWSRDGTKKDATKTQKVASFSNEVATEAKPKKSERYPNGHPGNPNPPNQFTKRNQAARKHGLRAKYFTESQLEIIEDFEDFSLLDKLWMQIEIKFSAIIQMQKIMWVGSRHQTLDEVEMSSSGENGDMTKYKIVYAFEQFEAYIKAQARAMAEYRNLVNEYIKLSGEDDERRLKLEKMQLDVDKTKADIELTKIRTRKENGEEDVEHEDDGFFEALGATTTEVWGDENG